MTTKPLKQWGLKRAFNRRIKIAFDERGIEIPFPHRTVYMGEPKKGTAPPLYIQHKRNGNKEDELNT
jgi:small conductance mechanosensitive channel